MHHLSAKNYPAIVNRNQGTQGLTGVPLDLYEISRESNPAHPFAVTPNDFVIRLPVYLSKLTGIWNDIAAPESFTSVGIRNRIVEKCNLAKDDARNDEAKLNSTSHNNSLLGL